MMLFIWNLTELCFIYRVFQKKHLIFDDRFTKTMCMAITMTSSFALALYLELMLPADQIFYAFLPITIGLFIGWKFGVLIKAPATLDGIYTGTMGGIIGRMLGAVFKKSRTMQYPYRVRYDDCN